MCYDDLDFYVDRYRDEKDLADRLAESLRIRHGHQEYQSNCDACVRLAAYEEARR